MTPSNQHSDREALAAIIDRFAFDDKLWLHQVGAKIAADPEFREQRQKRAYKIADEILAAPSLSLVAARDEVAAHFHSQSDAGKVFSWERAQQWMKDNAYRKADALFASGILKPSSEVEAAAPTKTMFDSFMAGAEYAESQHGGAYCQIYVDEKWMRDAATEHVKAVIEAARVRSGKAEA